jgi:tetratricopeptide (TPR) repeat protein
MTHSFIEAQPDYYEKNHSLQAYRAVLEGINLAAPGTTLCMSSEGLQTAGRVYVLWQMFLGLLGFTNQTDEVQVSSECLKFLFYGVTHQYLADPATCTLLGEIELKCQRNDLRVSSAVREAFGALGQHAGRMQEEQALLIQDLSQRLIDFCRIHQEDLKPYFWHRLSAETIDLPLNPQFGQTYLSLAEQTSNVDAPDRQDVQKAIRYYKIAAQNYHSQASRYSERLYLSFSSFIVNFPTLEQTLPQQIASIYLLIAEREHHRGQFSHARECFTKVDELDTTGSLLEQRHLIQWTASCLEGRYFRAAENLMGRIDASHLNAQLAQAYIHACIKMGDHFFAKKGTLTTGIFHVVSLGNTPNSLDHCRKAIGYYDRAMKIANLAREKALIQKITQAVREMPADDQKRREYLDIGSQLLKSQEWEMAAHFFLVAMHYPTPKDLLSAPQGREAIAYFTQAISELYKNGSKEHLMGLIDQALECIGDIKDQLYTENTGIIKREPGAIRSNISGFLNEMGCFTWDVGSNLHFIKAEILAQSNQSQEEILKEYVAAAGLAPNNPFGAGALFMIDKEKSAAADLSVLIEAYRKLAFEYGAFVD